jgi:hypothetical protein
MNRGASGAVIAEIGADKNRPIHLFELYLDGATTYATDAFRTMVWNATTYPALGHFLDYDRIEETGDLSITPVTVQMSGVDQTLIAAVLAHEYIDRRLVIRKAFLSGASAVIVDPLPSEFRVDSMSIEEDPDSGKCVVAISASSHWIDFERTPGRHTNHEEQQIWFPGDLGFEYVSQLNREIKWGVA